MSKFPKEWEIKELSEVASIQTGLAKGKNNLKDPVTLPYLRVANVQDGYLDLTNLKTIQVAKSEISRYRLKPNDVVLTEGGDLDKLGRGYVWHGQVEPCLHQNHIFVVRPFMEKLRPEFLALLTSSPYGRMYFLSCAKQTTNLASINSTQLKEFPVVLPPLSEQDRIIQIFSSWNISIAQTDSILASKRELKRGLMKHLLAGSKRFPEFHGQEWIKVKAGEVFRSVSVKGNKNEELLSATQDKGIIPRSMLQARVTMPTGDTSSFKLVEVGDFVISLRSFQGGLEYSYYRGIVSPAYTVLKPSKKINTEFYKQYFKSYEFIGRLATAVIGIRDGKQVSYEDFCLVHIPFPSIEEQERIAGVLNTCDKEIELLERQLDAIKRQRRGLMQKLLTGHIRVKVDEAEAITVEAS